MTGLVLALVAAAGVFYLYTAVVLEWSGLRPGPAVGERGVRGRARAADWLVQAGLAEVDPREFATVTAVLAAAGLAVGGAMFGGPLPAAVLAACLATVPLASYRVRRNQRRAAAQESWPRILEEIRILTSGLGRSVPQALFEAGRRAPDSLRPAFAAAQREWLTRRPTPPARRC